MSMFAKTALYYDKIYSFKDYRSEAERLMAIFTSISVQEEHNCSTLPVGRLVIWSI